MMPRLTPISQKKTLLIALVFVALALPTTLAQVVSIQTVNDANVEGKIRKYYIDPCGEAKYDDQPDSIDPFGGTAKPVAHGTAAVMGTFQVFFQSAGTFNVNFSFPLDTEPSFAVTPLQQGGIAAKPNGPDISGNSYTATIDFSGHV